MTNLGPLDTYLAKQSAATEMVGRIDTLTKDIARRIESARVHELQAEEDRAAAAHLDRIRDEYETARTAYVRSQVVTDPS